MLLDNIPPSSNLDRMTGTFTKDKEFFDALTRSPVFQHVCRIIVYARWWRKWHFACLDGLQQAIRGHFPAKFRKVAEVSTALLTVQLAKDVGLIGYLVCRGLTQEAGGGLRRMFENIAVMGHFWKEPEKVALMADPDSLAYRRAFVIEEDKRKQAALKVAGISKRFAALDGSVAQGMTALYALISDYHVHGGTRKHNLGMSIEKNRFWCFFLSRTMPNDSIFNASVDFIAQGLEMTTVEYSLLIGEFGKKTPDVLESGRAISRLLGNPGEERTRMSLEVEAVRRDLIGNTHSLK
jgi:hypothetical protein